MNQRDAGIAQLLGDPAMRRPGATQPHVGAVALKGASLELQPLK